MLFTSTDESLSRCGLHEKTRGMCGKDGGKETAFPSSRTGLFSGRESMQVGSHLKS